ncbi:MAG: HAD family hydrolase [Burkholderia sp.]
MHSAAVFLDKDGTLLDDVPYNVDPARMRFAPGAREALALLATQPFALIVISNQPGVALGQFAPEALDTVAAHLRTMFADCGAVLADVYWCPHHPRGQVAPYALACACRKPAPGMLQRAVRDHALDPGRSWFVGDILDDVEAGNRAGCRTLLIDNGNETEWKRGPFREPAGRASNLHAAARRIVAAREAADRTAPHPMEAPR